MDQWRITSGLGSPANIGLVADNRRFREPVVFGVFWAPDVLRDPKNIYI